MTTITKDITKDLECIKSAARLALAAISYNKECEKMTFTDMTDAIKSVDSDPSAIDHLIEIRDEFVDAGRHQIIIAVIDDAVEAHNHEVKMNAELDRIAEEDAKKQAELDALTETEIAHIFDDYLSRNCRYPHFKMNDMTCSLAVFASISENSFAVKYFQHKLGDDDTITFELVYDCDCIDEDIILEDLETQLSDLRADLQSAIENADFDEIDYIKYRIQRISSY